MKVQPKKHLGQHFLNDSSVCLEMAQRIEFHQGATKIIEIGPGTGALTKFLLALDKDLEVYEVDHESVAYLHIHYPRQFKIHQQDFLKAPLDKTYNEPFVVAGNFPYNISSQILFKIYETRELVPEVIGMFQKEVAERVASPPGSKKYGILSVLLQAFYDIEYILTVPPESFTPPPKVDSGVIHLKWNGVKDLGVDHHFFKKVVKAAFNLRRKTLRNSLKSIGEVPEPYTMRRPEQMSVQDFIELTKILLKA
ncbi:MAG: ribosomal RNA small subunit methyltransferase A [Flavobacteriales bacterium]|nr:ribosomal RNA small subunit methyltransferase A [Flavobacteriales bacterium]